MTDRSPTPRPSWRTAALGAVGGLMVLLPLGEVMRHQALDIRAMTAERALLDPLSQAVAVQRGLLSHSDLCQRLLVGGNSLEPERKLRQSVVDSALWELKSTLSAGLWVSALGEAGQLTLDWRDLTQRFQARSVDGKTSLAQHRLLIEQTLQVMDLVTATAPSMGTPHQLALRSAAGNASLADRESQGADAKALARVQNQLLEHSQTLDERLTRLHTARAWTGAMVLGLLLLAAAALLWWRSRSAPPTATPLARDGIRLSQGRRATDADRAPSATQRLLWKLRQGSSSPSAAYRDTLPPGA